MKNTTETVAGPATLATVTVYHEVWTPEDMEIGEPSEAGESCAIIIDESDIDEDTSLVDAIARELRRRGITEPSATQFHPGVWYIAPDPDRNFHTGGETVYSAHIDGTAPEIEAAVFRAITGRV